MILGPITLLDCAVFLSFLAPQLLLSVGIFKTSSVIIQALPFLRRLNPVLEYSINTNGRGTVFELPVGFIVERYFTHPSKQLPFTQGATAFEDFVVRCVRYAFKYFPASVGRVFFSKYVALGFLRWRMLRHGHIRSPVHYRECSIGEVRRSYVPISISLGASKLIVW